MPLHREPVILPAIDTKWFSSKDATTEVKLDTVSVLFCSYQIHPKHLVAFSLTLMGFSGHH